MEFSSAYAQGFARVAACTMPVALADPAANARTVVAVARECHDDGVAVAVFPELCLSGYSIEDLLLQDTLLNAVQEAITVQLHGLQRCRPSPAIAREKISTRFARLEGAGVFGLLRRGRDYCVAGGSGPTGFSTRYITIVVKKGRFAPSLESAGASTAAPVSERRLPAISITLAL